MPASSFARIHTAPVPPINPNGLSPIELCRTLKREHNGVIRIWTNRIEFVRNPQNDARRVGPVGVQFTIVGKNGKLLIDSQPGESLRCHLLAIQVAIDAQIAPFRVIILRQIHAERCVFQVLELLAIRIASANCFHSPSFFTNSFR